MKNETKHVYALSTDPFYVEGVPLRKHVAAIETRITLGMNAVNLELSQMLELFELLLRQKHTWLEHSPLGGFEPDSGDDRAPAGCVSGEPGEKPPNERYETVSRRPDETAAFLPPVNGDVHRLHELLRGMKAESVDSPSKFDNAPGYYAVYFTDESDGIKVEYVHAGSSGGGP